MMTKETGTWRVLITDDEFAETAATLGSRYEGLELLCPTEGQELRELCDSQVDVLISQFVPVDKDLLNQLSGLKMVVKLWTNFKNIDADEVRGRGLTTASSPVVSIVPI